MYCSNYDYYEIYNNNYVKLPIVDCSICLESKIDYINDYVVTICEYPIQLQKTEYYTTCKCNILIHPYCLTIWYNLHKNCPICKQHIYQNCIKFTVHAISNFYKTNNSLILFTPLVYFIPLHILLMQLVDNLLAFLRLNIVVQILTIIKIMGIIKILYNLFIVIRFGVYVVYILSQQTIIYDMFE
jgi:hypothetical protein